MAREHWLDFLRLVAVGAVVFLHSSVPFVLGFKKVSSLDWWTGNLIDSSVRWGVPVLVMITGALLFNQKRDALKPPESDHDNRQLMPAFD